MLFAALYSLMHGGFSSWLPYAGLCFCARWDIQNRLPKPEGIFVLVWVYVVVASLVAFIFHAVLNSLLAGANWLWSQWSSSECCCLKGWHSGAFPCMLANWATFFKSASYKHKEKGKKKKGMFGTCTLSKALFRSTFQLESETCDRLRSCFSWSSAQLQTRSCEIFSLCKALPLYHADR